MAKVMHAEIDNNSIIVGIHSDAIPAANLPTGYTSQEIEVEDPNGLLGQHSSLISETVDKRAPFGIPTDQEVRRTALKNLSIELDLQERMGEDTTNTQAEFDALKAVYENPSS